MAQSDAGTIIIQGARVFDGEAFLDGTPDVVVEVGRSLPLGRTRRADSTPALGPSPTASESSTRAATR